MKTDPTARFASGRSVRPLCRRDRCPHSYDAMMSDSTVLAATWNDGLFALSDGVSHQERPGQEVKGLVSDGHGGALAIVDGHALCRRLPGGAWNTVATSNFPLACAVSIGDVIYVGTDDAQMLRISADGRVRLLDGFSAVPGRENWYAGTALVGGRIVGPPLGVRSIAATSDGAVLLANVHVGGIARSTDGGVTWLPTINIDTDVHEVCAHPKNPATVFAAAAVGLCISRDSGATWTIEQEGLHAFYCSAVAITGDTVLVAASSDHFAARGAVYARPIEGGGPPARLSSGFPKWLDGIADTGCIAARERSVAVADKGGSLYISEDGGSSWSRSASGLPPISGVLVIG